MCTIKIKFGLLSSVLTNSTLYALIHSSDF